MTGGGTVAPHLPHTHTFRQEGKLNNTFLLSNEGSALKDESAMSHLHPKGSDGSTCDFHQSGQRNKMVPFGAQKAPRHLERSIVYPENNGNP